VKSKRQLKISDFNHTKAIWQAVMSDPVFSAYIHKAQSNPNRVCQYANEIRAKFNLSPFWEGYLCFSLQSKKNDDIYSNIQLGGAPQRWGIVCEKNSGKTYKVCFLDVYPETTVRDIRRTYPLIKKRFREVEPETDAKNPTFCNWLDPITNQIYYTICIFPKTTRILVEDAFKAILQKYKADKFRRRRVRKTKDFAKECLSLRLKDKNTSMKDIANQLQMTGAMEAKEKLQCARARLKRLKK